MQKSKFITLYGKKRSGKNTVAKAISNYIRKQKILRLFGLGKKIQWKVRREASFAKPLRQIIGILYDIPDEILYDDSKKNTFVNVRWEDLEIDSDKSGQMTLRELLQALGTDLFREKWSKNIWAQIPFRKDYSDNSFILITDSRFENELRMTRKHQGINIHIVRPGQTHVDTHASENQDIPEELFDFTIIGKEGVGPLTMQVYELLNENFERIFS